MTRLVRRGPGLRYPEDVAALLAVLSEAGYDADPRDVEWAWEECASPLAYGGWWGGDEIARGVKLFGGEWVVDQLLKYLEPEGGGS